MYKNEKMVLKNEEIGNEETGGLFGNKGRCNKNEIICEAIAASAWEILYLRLLQVLIAVFLLFKS